MNVEWGQTTYSGREKSWHIFREVFDYSLCGRPLVPSNRKDTPPGGKKSCESCLRIYARLTDKA